jgi:hypothetical protein
MNDKNITANFFDIGYESGLNALEYIAKHNEQRFLNENPHHEQLAGLLSSIMNCIYYYAPNEKAASQLVQFAVDFAIDENAKIGMVLPKGH